LLISTETAETDNTPPYSQLLMAACISCTSGIFYDVNAYGLTPTLENPTTHQIFITLHSKFQVKSVP